MPDFYYRSSTGAVIDFRSSASWGDEIGIHSYAWAYDAENNRIGRFSRKPAEIPLRVYFRADTASDCAALRSETYAVFDSDVRTQSPGRLYYGAYYLECYITAMGDERANIDYTTIQTALTIVAPSPDWHTEQAFQFLPSAQTDDGLDFPFDFPFDCAVEMPGEGVLDNGYAFPADFRLTIYGPAVSPSISIGGHTYALTDEVPEASHIVIDSAERTIVRITNTGQKSNWFGKRFKPESIFQKISVGRTQVRWDGSFGFDLTLIDTRSEPVWEA